jgi:hypothetical protein
VQAVELQKEASLEDPKPKKKKVHGQEKHHRPTHASSFGIGPAGEEVS